MLIHSLLISQVLTNFASYEIVIGMAAAAEARPDRPVSGRKEPVCVLVEETLTRKKKLPKQNGVRYGSSGQFESMSSYSYKRVFLIAGPSKLIAFENSLRTP